MLGGRRRLPVGAEPSPKIGRGVHFRVWAPHAETLEVVVEGGEATGLEREPDGYFSGVVDAAEASARPGSRKASRSPQITRTGILTRTGGGESAKRRRARYQFSMAVSPPGRSQASR